jgi:hypothetical protein
VRSRRREKREERKKNRVMKRESMNWKEIVLDEESCNKKRGKNN